MPELSLTVPDTKRFTAANKVDAGEFTPFCARPS